MVTEVTRARARMTGDPVDLSDEPASADASRPETSVAGREGHPRWPRRILVVQTQRIGDVLCMTPTLTALRSKFPQARLVALVQPPAHHLLSGNADLDDCIVYDPRQVRRRLWKLAGLACTLLRQRFDWSITIHAARNAGLALGLSGIPWRTCVWRYGRAPAWKRLYHQHLIQNRRLGECHEVEYNLGLLEALGIPGRHHGLSIALPTTAMVTAQAKLEAAGIRRGARFAVLHPGHSGGRQEWPTDFYASLGDRLSRSLGLEVALTGTSQEAERCETVVAAMKSPAVNLAGSLSLVELGAALSGAAVFVSVPTGPMHLAAAVGTPAVALYGPGELMVDRKRFHPYYAGGHPGQRRYAEVVSGVPCDCSRMRECGTSICMRGITPEMVFEAVSGLL